MLRIFRWMRKEMIALIPVFFYFTISFNLVHFAQGLMLRPGDIRFTSYFGATLGAVFAAKVILIVENLPFINLFPKRPILYNVTWKFCIYSFFVLLVQILDYTSRQFYHTRSWWVTFLHLKADLTLSLFWGVQISVLLFFLIFIIFSELVRVLGPTRMKKIFFGSRKYKIIRNKE